uniref:Uncharacterized protein n=1 Tax=Opuntia streptacantha TaxID=393608 RepID=A0A7C9EJE0_OPUST
MYARALHSVVSNTLRSVNFPKSFGNSLRFSHPSIDNTLRSVNFPKSFGNSPSLSHLSIDNTLRLVSLPKFFGNSLSLPHPLKYKTCKLCSFVIELGSISSSKLYDRSRYRKCNRLPNVLGNSVILDQLKSNALRDFQLFSKAPNAIHDSGPLLPTPRYVRILPPVKRLAVPLP